MMINDNTYNNRKKKNTITEKYLKTKKQIQGEK